MLGQDGQGPNTLIDTTMDFANLSALTTPEIHNIPSPPYQPSTFSNPHSTNSQHSTTSPSNSSTPSSTAGLKKEAPAPSNTNRKRGRDNTSEDDDAALKRHRNTLAARKYRQKRLDRIKELEDALEEVTGERDELRIKLARQEAENEALKTMMKMRAEK